MKNFVVMLCAFLFLLSPELFSQSGTEFWFSIPFIKKAASEGIRNNTTNSPFELWITAEKETQVSLYNSSGTLLMNKTILAKESSITAITDGYINSVSETIATKGLRLVADKPISVTVYMSYKSSGEAFTVLPIDMLGTEYYTMNLYQDYFKFIDQSIQATVGQILIVATDNGTQVEITPTVDTEGNHIKNSSFSVNLRKGETYLVKAKVMENMNQTWETDLTGSYIKSNKPVAVFSGHTKGTFPRQAVNIFNMYTDFLRNPYFDAVLPINMCGTEFASAPIIYSSRTTGYGTIPDDKGDVIRFVALEDNTEVFQMNKAGDDLVKLGTIDKGENLKIIEQVDAAYYTTSKKVMAAQYAKSWLRNAQATSSGQGMLQTLLPTHLWNSSTSFNSSANGINNFVTIIFKTKDLNRISFDDRVISDEFGTKIKKINGTPYSYLSGSVNSGKHFITSNRKTVKFCAYFYGNLDNMRDGFAYGSFAGIYNDKSCDDTLRIDKTMNCNTYQVNAVSIDLENIDCSEIKDLRMNDTKSYNFVMSNSAFTDEKKSWYRDLAVIDNSIPAHAEISAETFSGIIVTEKFSFTPDSVLYSNSKMIDFGLSPKTPT